MLLTAEMDAYQISLPQLFAIKHHRNTLDQPMRFDGDIWLVDIYQDGHPQIAVMKSVQCGISEWLIIDSLAACFKGLSVIYVVPTKTFRTDFVTKRIDGLKDRVPFYGKAIGEADNKGIKQIWKGYLRVAAANNKNDALSDPGQVLIFDELDQHDTQFVPLFLKRLDSARKLTGREPLIRKASNPTITGFGIHAEYEKSDQRKWFVKCRCGHEQPLDWFMNFVRETAKGHYELLDDAWQPGCGRDIHCFCSKCNKPMDRLGPGRWVITNPDSDIHGYHVSQLFNSQRSIAEIWAEFKNALSHRWEMQAFWNGVLGLPYTDSGHRISPDLLQSCADPDYKLPIKFQNAVAGIDQGAGTDFHVHVSALVNGKRQKVWMRHVPMTEDMADLDFIFNTFNVRCCVMDAMPETTLARKFQKRWRGKVFLCRFMAGQSIKEAKPDRKTGEIHVDRTQAFDCDFYSWSDGNVILPPDWRDLDGGEFARQMCVNTKVLEEDDKGNKRYVWKKGRDAADHHHLASIYERLALHIAASVRLTIMGK